jgi:membrane protease YdiL (CAAX protease family)
MRVTQERADGPDYALVPRDRSFLRSFPAFALPYAAYAALASLPHRFLAPAAAEALRFAAVALLLLAFRRAYRLGPRLDWRQASVAVPVAAAALAVWVVLYRLGLALPPFRAQMDAASAADPGPAYALLRALNSVLLVPVFEELFCRGYVGELLHGMPAGPGGFSARLGVRMDDHPAPLAEPPLGRRAVYGSALIFVLGHPLAAWPAALAYFALTTVLYRQTRSFRACVLVHALVNLGIAALVLGVPEMRFLWY